MTSTPCLRRQGGLGRATLLAVVLSVGLLGCRTTHPLPEGELSTARAAIATAEEAGAAEHAPVEIRRARQKLEQSQTAIERGDHLQARILLEQAEVDARAAELTARANRQEATLATIRSSIAALREEIERSRRIIEENRVQ
jgi:hypothetical protein